MTLIIGIALLVCILGAIGYLVCVQPSKASFGELCRIAFFVGLFFVVSGLSSHVWRLS